MEDEADIAADVGPAAPGDTLGARRGRRDPAARSRDRRLGLQGAAADRDEAAEGGREVTGPGRGELRVGRDPGEQGLESREEGGMAILLALFGGDRDQKSRDTRVLVKT